MAPRRSSDDAGAPRAAALEIVRTLRDGGHVAYFSGGCVRDEVMGLAPQDYDVATDAPPDRVRELFRNTRAVGEHFGVMLVRLRGQIIEVATFRHEWGYTDKRRPDRVEFTDARGDAARRDFTINGLFMDPLTGDVIDYVVGRADIENRIIRAIGNPAERLAEDHLRALRAVRFAARLGFTIEEATADAVRRDAAALHGVSRERIGMEVRMMLVHPSRAIAANLLHELALDAPVLEEPNDPRHVRILAGLDTEPDADEEAVFPTALAAWTLDRHPPDEWPATIVRWRRSLMLSNAQREGYRAILSILRAVHDDWPSMTVAGQKRLAAGKWFDGAMTVLRAADPGRHDAIRARCEELARTRPGLAPPPLLTGDDLVAMGYEPGPDFKAILDAVYDAQLEGRIDSADQARLLARSIAAAHD